MGDSVAEGSSEVVRRRNAADSGQKTPLPDGHSLIAPMPRPNTLPPGFHCLWPWRSQLDLEWIHFASCQVWPIRHCVPQGIEIKSNSLWL